MGEIELVEALGNLDERVDPPDQERERIWGVLVSELERATATHAGPSAGSGGAREKAKIGRGLGLMVAAAAVIFTVAFGVAWLHAGGGPGADGPTTDTASESGFVALPESHPAAQILAEGDDITRFSERARELGLPFQCMSGGMSRLCLVYSDGLMAVVPLATGPGFGVTISGEAVDMEVTVPIDGGPVAVPGPGGRVEAVILDARGEQVARMHGLLPSRPQEELGSVTDLPESHPAASLIADGVSYSSILDTVADAEVDSLCGGSDTADYRLCVIYSDGLLAVLPFGNLEGTVARVSGEGVGGQVTVPIVGSEPIAIVSAGGQVTVFVERHGEGVGSMTGMAAGAGD